MSNMERFFSKILEEDFSLKDREKRVLTLRLHKKTLKEVGEEIGVTRERVRQIEAKALRKLFGHYRWYLKEEGEFRQYLAMKKVATERRVTLQQQIGVMVGMEGGSLSVLKLPFPTRVINALLKAGYSTERELAEQFLRDAGEIWCIKNIGDKGYGLIEDYLVKRLRDEDG